MFFRNLWLSNRHLTSYTAMLVVSHFWSCSQIRDYSKLLMRCVFVWEVCNANTYSSPLCESFFHSSAKSPWWDNLLCTDPSASIESNLWLHKRWISVRALVGLTRDSHRVACVSGRSARVTRIRQLRSPWWLCHRAGHKRHSTLKCQSTASGLGPAFTPPIKTKTKWLPVYDQAFHTPFHAEL